MQILAILQTVLVVVQELSKVLQNLQQAQPPVATPPAAAPHLASLAGSLRGAADALDAHAAPPAAAPAVA